MMRRAAAARACRRSPGSAPQSRQSAGITVIARGAGHSQAAPRTPEESPCLFFTTGVLTKSENTYRAQQRRQGGVEMVHVGQPAAQNDDIGVDAY